MLTHTCPTRRSSDLNGDQAAIEVAAIGGAGRTQVAGGMAERNHIRTAGYRVRTKRDAVDARCAAAMAQCHAVIGIAESKVAYGNGELAIGFAGVTCGYTCLTTRIAGEIGREHV